MEGTRLDESSHAAPHGRVPGLGGPAHLATVATVAAPASAGKCEPFTGSFPAGAEGCYYATGPITGYPDVPAGVTLNGSDADDDVGYVDGIFNGGSGDDHADGVNGTYNGGPGNDGTAEVSGTFNGGSGDDYADFVASFPTQGTFNGGSGDDCVYGSSSTTLYGTFAGGGGS